MSVISYDFLVVDSNGVLQTGIPFTTNGLASPGLASLATKPNSLLGISFPILPTISNSAFVELGNGYYTFLFDADAQGFDCFAVIDAGPSLSNASRYIGLALNRDSSRIQQIGFTGGDVLAYAVNGGAGSNPAFSNAAVTLNLTSASGSYTNAPLYPFNIGIVRGTDETFSFTVTGGLPPANIDITGSSILLLVKQNITDNDIDAVLTKSTGSAAGIVITDSTQGTFTVTFSNRDFDDITSFPDNSIWYWGLKLFQPSGVESPISSGSLKVVPFPVQTITAPV